MQFIKSSIALFYSKLFLKHNISSLKKQAQQSQTDPKSILLTEYWDFKLSPKMSHS